MIPVSFKECVRYVILKTIPEIVFSFVEPQSMLPRIRSIEKVWPVFLTIDWEFSF